MVVNLVIMITFHNFLKIQKNPLLLTVLCFKIFFHIEISIGETEGGGPLGAELACEACDITYDDIMMTTT